jgi:excinuclease ABC subunit A
VPPLDKKYKHDIDVVVDRIVVRDDIAAGWPTVSRPRCGWPTGWRSPNSPTSRWQTADTSAGGSANKSQERNPRAHHVSRKSSPARFPASPSEIEPRLFSFNNPHGACPTCDGLGTEIASRPLVVPGLTLSLRQGAVVPWAKIGVTSPYYTQTLEAVCKHYGFKP